MTLNKFLNQANCEMKVICEKKWNDLNQTEEEGIRFCSDCKKLVFYTKTSEELKIAAKKGVCVFIESGSSAEYADILEKKIIKLEDQFSESFERIRQIDSYSIRPIKHRTLGVVITKPTK
jgi:hypothetical protein